MTNNFAITSINILKSKHWKTGLLKILKQGTTYQLSRYDDTSCLLDDNFFGKNITVSAIVGKNGSGKSSLLDILYRVVNNLAHCMIEAIANHDQDKWGNYHHLDYCFGMYVDVHYVSDGKAGVIMVRDNVVAIKYGEKLKSVFRPVPKVNKLFIYKNYYLKSAGVVPSPFEDFELVETGNISDFQEVADSLFYSIVTSYAMQSFLSSDYQDEETLWNHHRDEPIINELKPDFAVAWIDALFHKNDGYTTPIVLNPFRHHGIIDMQKEKYLTLNRVASLLLYYHHLKPEPELIEGYNYGGIRFVVNLRIVVDKCAQALLNKMNIPAEQYNASLLQFLKITGFFSTMMNSEAYLANYIIKEYGFTPVPYDDTAKGMPYSQPLFAAQMYLVYKTLAIASKLYPGYEQFQGINVDGYINETIDDKDKCERISELIKKINSDTTHITLKIRQTKLAIKALTSTKVNKHMMEGYFTYEDYCEALGISLYRDVHSIQDVQETMPPNYFVPEICLKRKSEDDLISLNTLSTGERQMVFTISTLVYHSLNILSVSGEDRLKYRRFCYILDEVEICFHPEYQRLFINTLISTITRLGINQSAQIHILLSTHSPFILSDIPSSNILYLKEGNVEEKTNPFAANVNEILADSFFLSENGYIGEFARKKLLYLKHYLEDHAIEVDYWDEDAKDTRNPDLFLQKMLSDSLLRKVLMDLNRSHNHVAD